MDNRPESAGTSKKKTWKSKARKAKKGTSNAGTSVFDPIPELEISPTQIQIIQKFDNGTYSIFDVPDILWLDNLSGVYVSVDGPHLNEIKALEDGKSNTVLTPKLKALSYGDSTLSIGIISTKYFKSRERLHVLYSKEWDWTIEFPDVKPIKIFTEIPFEEAVRDHLNFTISCNMEYYLANPDEIEKDLNRKLENFDPNNNHLMMELEKELFFQQCIKIFGDENDEEEKKKSTVLFRDFQILRDEYDKIYATARRGDYYLIFFYQF